MDKKILLLVIENRPHLLAEYVKILLLLGKNNVEIMFWEYPQARQIWYMRQQMLKDALQTECTHIFFLDTDVLPTQKQLEKLFSYDEDFISGYYQDQQKTPCVRKDKKPYIGKGVEEVDLLSMGFSLMKREVAEKVEYTMPNPLYKLDGDVEFCKAVKEAGYKVKVDFDLKAYHFLLSFH